MYVSIAVIFLLDFLLIFTLSFDIKIFLFYWNFGFRSLVVIDRIWWDVNVSLCESVDTFEHALNIAPLEPWKIYYGFPLIGLRYVQFFIKVLNHHARVYMLFSVSYIVLVLVMPSSFVVPEGINKTCTNKFSLDWCSRLELGVSALSACQEEFSP